MVRRPQLRTSRTLTAAAALSLVIPLVTLSGASALASPSPVTAVSPTGSVTVQVKGNGHGHGMSQYGARGAAIAGLTYRQIVAFYYPHTTLTVLKPSWVRVRLSGPGSTTSVLPASGLTVSGVGGYLPTTGLRAYRLIADAHSGLTLQQRKTARGSWWTNYRTGLAGGASFHRSNGYSIRLLMPDGSSTAYYGALSAVRANATGTVGGVYTVDVVSLDHYAAGVTPREMPASWESAAVQAQAVAARTYGRYAVEHPQSSTYDLCDSTNCQVYGGHVHFSSSGALAWTDDSAAVTGDANQVLRYGGRTIFAQFGASDGGWTTDGGQPYLTAHLDTYDNARSGDPYLSYSSSSSSASLASYFGLRTLTGIAVTGRDGHGTWGGRVTAGYVQGTNAAKKTVKVTVTGYDLQYAFGVGSTWLRVP